MTKSEKAKASEASTEAVPEKATNGGRGCARCGDPAKGKFCEHCARVYGCV